MAFYADTHSGIIAVYTDLYPYNSQMINAVNFGLVQRADHQDDSNSQVQSDIHRAVVELTKLADIVAELEKLHFRLDDDQKPRWAEDQDFLGQISTLDFTSMQKEAYSKRYGGTGQWVLETSEFQTWFKSEDGQHSVLWCPGNPGVGKTVVTSIAVNHVIENTGERKSAIVYLYCDYGNPLTFSVDNLLGSLVRQLVAQTSHAETIAELRTSLAQTTKSRNMTEEELSSWIENLSRTFDVVYTFVDALDECPEIARDSLLLRLQQYSVGNMRIFLTSRLNVDVRDSIPHATRAEISATKYDITDYVEAKIQKSRRLANLTAGNPDLKRHIIESIVSKADGMFLLAGLQTESLGDQISVRGVRLALERLPTDIFTMYDQTFKRIREQSTEKAELGLKVFSIIFGATRPLEVDELRHALAIQPGDTDLDVEASVDVETLLGVTAGLVITHLDKYCKQKVFRLVHYTLQEYLQISQKRLLPNLELDMARTCLAYLCLGEFGNGQSATYGLLHKRTDDFCFFNYAADHWAIHLRGVQMELMDQSLAFVQDSKKTSAWLQAFEDLHDYHAGLSSKEDVPLDPVFLAAHFHLSELFTRLTLSRNINTRNKRRETPLIRAVDVHTWQKGGKPTYHSFQGFKGLQNDEEAASLPFLDADQHTMVQMLLDRNADIEAKDNLGKTAICHAVTQNKIGILSLLLDRGADVDAGFSSGDSPLQVATKFGCEDIVLLLLDRGADVNVLTKKGESLIDIAVNHPISTILTYLIDHGLPFDIADEFGVTPLMVAAGNGRLETLTTLIERGACRDITDPKGKSLLHLAVLAPHPRPNVVEVVMQTQNVNVIDMRGRTPLHYAYYFWAAQRTNERNKIKIAAVIRLLIEGGASETVVDADGKIPKYYLDWSPIERDSDGQVKLRENTFE